MTSQPPPHHPTVPGEGEMARRIRELDWSRTPVGPIESWPQSLKIAVQILLTSRYAMWMGWGPEFTFFCNDAYLPTVGVKRDWVLGASARKVWAEIWPEIGPRAESVVRTGRATWDEGLRLFLQRSGYPEETYHTFSYSPVPDDRGGTGGMLCVVTEDTERIISERRLALLGELASDLAATQEEPAVFAALERRVAKRPQDLPFLLVYLFGEDQKSARLASCSGIHAGDGGAPEIIDFDSGLVWPAAEILAHPSQITVEDLVTRFPSLPTGPWDKPPRQAVLTPIAKQGQDRPAGFLVAGINPYRPLDADYRQFLSLMAGQIAAGVSNARAYGEERRRAAALAELDRAKTAFFSNVSHEFRTPLTLMLGPLEDALRRSDEAVPEPLKAELDVVRRNGVRLLKLVNSLLDFARIEAGRTEARYEPADIGALTAELASTFRSAVERAGMRLTVECDRLAQPVYLDHDMWEKVVLNLLSNAFKHTFEGEIRVAVHRRGSAVEVSVRDTGVGIPPEALPRLFDRFYRVQGARSRSHEGSGIGLALVHELVKLHGGSVEVRSEVGRGSEFIIFLPLGRAHLPEGRITAPRTLASTAIHADAYVEEALRWVPAAAPDRSLIVTEDVGGSDAGPAPCAGARILLADDNADMREYILRLLAPHYRVEAVPDGDTALQSALRERPDLVLTDVMMPGLDGFALMRALREHPRTREVPVVLLSARAGEEPRVEGLEAGASDYLVKPFSARELLARIGAQLTIAQLRGEALERERALRAEAETLNALAADLSAQLDLQAVLQKVTDAGTQLSGAAFGAFFYNAVNEEGELYMLYTLSGAPREAFDGFGMPRNTAVFAPTFRGESIVRSDDITKDPRYGKNAPRRGMPEGHLPVRSYLAVPVKSRSGEVIGGLFFGHPEPAVFTEQSERVIAGIASHAAIAVDNARLYGQARKELEERTRVQNALHESESNLRTILALLPVGVYACDAEGRITFFNRRAAELWGREPSPETRYCACHRAYTPDGALIPHSRTPMGQAVQEGRRSRDEEVVVERPDGSRFTASVNIDPILGDHGRPTGAISVFQDVSVQAAARDALRRQREALEEAVTQRTAELEESHRRLRLTERMASLGTLSAGLGHDVGNLLLPVRVSLEALAAAGLAEPLQTEVERIRTSAQYLQQLANGLRMMALDPGKAESGESLHVRAWWEDASRIIKNAVPRSVVLTPEIDGDLWIRISRPALTQVVFNLVQNSGDALRGREDGRVRITIQKDGDHALVTVEDNGHGMTPDVRDRCMEPFFTTKARGISTGLGLVLVGGLIREVGGSLNMHTEPGVGTRFTLRLPAAKPVRLPASAGGRALVRLTDQRLRAFVSTELRSLAFSVVTDETLPPPATGFDLVVSDDPASLDGAAAGARRTVLLSAAAPATPGVTALGPRPKPGALRDALQGAARELREAAP